MVETTVDQVDHPVKKPYQYHDNQRRTKLVIYSFLTFAIVCLLMPPLGVLAFLKFRTAMHVETQHAQQAFYAVADVYDLVSILSSILYLICAIIWLFWIYRASKNTHAQHPDTKIKYTPGWSVGSYFIPILAFFWPYFGMKEMWLLNNGKANPGRAIVLLWWFAYLLMNLFSKAVIQYMVNDVTDFENYLILDGVSNIFGAISALLALQIARKINWVQTTRQGDIPA